MDYRVLDEVGSFKVWGMGFHFEYDALSGVINIFNAHTSHPITYIESKKFIRQNPFDFVALLDKTLQILSLNYSNNTYLDLTEVLDSNKLLPILQNAVAISENALRLKHHKRKDFMKSFMRQNPGTNLIIKKMKPTVGTLAFYATSFRTHSGQDVRARGFLLHHALSELADCIVRDIITENFLQSAETDAQFYLKISSDIFVLSCILNRRFIPTDYKKTQSSHAIGENFAV